MNKLVVLEKSYHHLARHLPIYQVTNYRLFRGVDRNAQVWAQAYGNLIPN
jgi:hypothetical protein